MLLSRWFETQTYDYMGAKGNAGALLAGFRVLILLSNVFRILRAFVMIDLFVLVHVQVDRAIGLTVSHVEKLREMSPLWEMVQEGIDIKSIQWSQH